METFRYKAKDETGKEYSGTMQAVDENDLHKRLRNDNKYLVSAKALKIVKHVKRLKANQIADYCRNIGQLLGSGITLVRALKIISEDESIKEKDRAIYADILKSVQSGMPLSDAMTDEGSAFPPLLINMFRSAETAGNMDKVSLQMASYYDKEYRLAKKISSSLTYPKILGVLLVAVVAIIMGYVVPQFKSLFDTMGTLPIATRLLLGLSNFVKSKWYVIVLFAIVAFVVFKVLMTIPNIKLAVDKLKLKIPLIGPLNRIIFTARFARTLSSLYSAGIPILACLEIARTTVDNRYIEKQFDEVIATVKSGGNLSAAIDSVDGFTKKLTSSILVGEESGSLDNMLTSIADQMEYDSEVAMNRMVSFIEPVMIIIMAVMVGFIMIAVIKPIYGSYQSIATQ